MAASLILKDKAGKAVGYVMRLAGKIACKLAESSAAEAELTVLFDDGKHAEFSLPANGREHRFSSGQREIRGAYAVLEGALYAATDEQASRAFCSAQHAQEKKRKKSETACKKEAVSYVNHIEESAAQQTRGKETAAHQLPERRWPPPPCIADARYVDGSWREGETGCDILA